MAAKLYGVLVGQPTQNLLATGSGFISNLYKDSRDQLLVRDYAITNNNVMGDQISVGSFKSTAFISASQSYTWSDALGAGVTVQIGDATYPNALVAGRSAIAGFGNLLINTASASGGANAGGRALWQLLGYPSDPARLIELLVTFAGANPVNGAAFAWQVVGRNP